MKAQTAEARIESFLVWRGEPPSLYPLVPFGEPRLHGRVTHGRGIGHLHTDISIEMRIEIERTPLVELVCKLCKFGLGSSELAIETSAAC